MADMIQIRRDTAANWTAANPILAQGELGAETNTSKIKIGNGSSTWSALSYLIDAGGYLTESSSNTLTNKTIAFASNTLTGVQAALTSGTTIKTVNSNSLLGSGDVAVQPTLVSGTSIKTINTTTLLGSGDIDVQPTLVSGTSIKTINSNNLLGSGDIAVGDVTLTGTQTLTSKTIEAGTFTNGYTEEVATANTSTAYTIDLAGGSVQVLTLTGSCTFTFPTATAGKGFIILLKQDATGSRTVTWPAAVKWPGGTAPTITATASKLDKYVFTADGTNWYGSDAGKNYTV